MATPSAWSKFRLWRRSRPFWGGLFLLLSALELFLSANLTLKNLQVHVGQEGYLSYLLPVILLLCAVLTWVSPGQRYFYGILGLLTALYSFIGLNLGGFFLGMLIGIIGGALVVSWAPPRVKPDDSGLEPDDSSAPDAADDLDADQHDPGHRDEHPAREHDDRQTTAILPGFPDDDQEPRPPSSGGGGHRKLFVITLVPLALTAALLLAGSHTPARADPECPKDLPTPSATAGSGSQSAVKKTAARTAAAKEAAKKATAKKETPAGTSGGATATPTPTPPADGGSGNPIVDGLHDFVDGVGKVLGIGGDESPSPPADPDPTPGATPDPSPTPSVTPDPPAGGTATPSAPGGPSESATPSPTPTVSDVPCLGPRVFKDAAPAGEPSVSIHGGLLEGKSLNMFGSTYDGTVDLQTATGPLKVLKFSMTRAVTEPFSLTIAEGGGRRTVLTTDQLTIQDNVKFYTPDFQGKLFGLFPVTFTPDSPPPVMLPRLFFSDVKINLALVTCDTLTAKPLLDLTETS